MANSKHLEILKQDVETWNKWRKENPYVRPDLQEANLRNTDLRKANLQEANLSGADLFLANFSGTYLMKANLTEANLEHTNLSEANLSGAILVGANLVYTELTEANLAEVTLVVAKLIGTNLTKANLTEVHFGYTVLAGVDFSETQGLNTCVLNSPCTIGTDTLAKSRGKIPSIFLKGCGLSDWEIEAAKLYQNNLTISQIEEISNKIFELRTSYPTKERGEQNSPQN